MLKRLILESCRFCSRRNRIVQEAMKLKQAAGVKAEGFSIRERLWIGKMPRFGESGTRSRCKPVDEVDLDGSIAQNSS